MLKSLTAVCIPNATDSGAEEYKRPSTGTELKGWPAAAAIKASLEAWAVSTDAKAALLAASLVTYACSASLVL